MFVDTTHYDEDLINALIHMMGYNRGNMAELMFDAFQDKDIDYYTLIKIARIYDERYSTNLHDEFKKLCQKESEKNE